MRLGEDLRFRVPRGVQALLSRVAVERELTVPELLRQIVRAELQESGTQGEVDVGELDWAPHGQRDLVGSTRRTLPPQLAVGIRRGIERSGLSIRQAAKIIGVDNSYLSRLSRGTRFPSHHVAARLVDRLPVDDETANTLLDLTREHAGV